MKTDNTYWLIDDATTSKALYSADPIGYDRETAIRAADAAWSRLTAREQAARDGFYVACGPEMDGSLDLDAAKVIKVYK